MGIGGGGTVSSVVLPLPTFFFIYLLLPHFKKNKCFYTPPPIPRNEVKEGMLESHCLSVHVPVYPHVHVFGFCPDNISWLAQPFVIKLGIVVYYHELECLAEKLICYLEGQGHSKVVYNQNITFTTISSKLLIRLQPDLVCWFITISQRIPRKIWLPCSRSRSQQMIKMSVNDCVDDIFWTTKHYVSRLGLMMHYYGLDLDQYRKIGLLSSRSGSQWGLIWLKYDCFFYIFWSPDPLQPNLVLWNFYYKQ